MNDSMECINIHLLKKYGGAKVPIHMEEISNNWCEEIPSTTPIETSTELNDDEDEEKSFVPTEVQIPSERLKEDKIPIELLEEKKIPSELSKQDHAGAKLAAGQFKEMMEAVKPEEKKKSVVNLASLTLCDKLSQTLVKTKHDKNFEEYHHSISNQSDEYDKDGMSVDSDITVGRKVTEVDVPFPDDEKKMPAITKKVNKEIDVFQKKRE